MMLLSQKLCYKYALITFLFFGLQGIVSTGGALETAFPDIPIPIPFTAGRSFHLNISIMWPLFGITGIIYFFFGREAGREIYSLKLIEANFWLFLVTIITILGSLVLGFNEGIEYLEALRPLKVGIAVSISILFYNLIRTYIVSKVPKSRATLVSILAGSCTLIVFFIPNILRYSHPVAEEFLKFWVVHLWEEMSLELIGTGVLAAVLVTLPGMQRSTIENVLYLDIIVMVVTGVLATGHHYYWAGGPSYWIWVGGAFSTIQIVPIFLLLYSIMKTVKLQYFSQLGQREKIVMAMIASSMFYHIFGAGLLGFLMAIPAVNKYIHGTYITSAHSHLAVFGVFGFLVLALSYYIFFSEIVLDKKSYWFSWIGILLLNGGLLTMSTALLVAGGLQSHFWYVLGLTVGETNQGILPWMLLRLAGGLTYTAGSSLLTYVIIKKAWSNFSLCFPSLKELEQQRCIELKDLHNGFQQLVVTASKLEQALSKTKLLLDKYLKIKP
ncbi:cbb3-type cytochrome c oxidase subunit I [Sporomusa sp.]|uniref:cbb3-type cytochrome c oxidase subunit I n=1 Tax=Sporomusa sp. TaxID=2078658 RepID=UPI002BADE790|nr:cbb3-type cytochrome c oxidase subunit I [Sporomusa sp.]HWR42953.1 cbb3-type cytochrome c oxidase subunit I [Sporomusa sp.]